MNIGFGGVNGRVFRSKLAAGLGESDEPVDVLDESVGAQYLVGEVLAF